jgi:hypothetical protein
MLIFRWHQAKDGVLLVPLDPATFKFNQRHCYGCIGEKRIIDVDFVVILVDSNHNNGVVGGHFAPVLPVQRFDSDNHWQTPFNIVFKDRRISIPAGLYE